MLAEAARRAFRRVDETLSKGASNPIKSHMYTILMILVNVPLAQLQLGPAGQPPCPSTYSSIQLVHTSANALLVYKFLL